MKKRYLAFGAFIGIGILLILCLNIHNTKYYTRKFYKIDFHIAQELEIEWIAYENSDFLEEVIIYTDVAELQYGKRILEQLNNASFIKGNSLSGSGYGRHMITFKFVGIEEELVIEYAGEKTIRMFGYNWKTDSDFYIDEEMLLNTSKQ